MATAIGYIRVSTREQAQEGISLDAQDAQVRAYCAYRGLELSRVIVDAGVSGSRPLARRVGGRQLLASTADVIVACKLDRLFRDASDALSTTKAWDRAGTALHLLDLGGSSLDTSTAMGRTFLSIVAVLGESERNQIVERTKSALEHKRAQGEYAGGRIPYGHRLADDGVHLEADDAELAVARAFEAQHQDDRSYAWIARHANSTNRGRRWTAKSVKNAIRALQQHA